MALALAGLPSLLSDLEAVRDSPLVMGVERLAACEWSCSLSKASNDLKDSKTSLKRTNLLKHQYRGLLLYLHACGACPLPFNPPACSFLAQNVVTGEIEANKNNAQNMTRM